MTAVRRAYADLDHGQLHYRHAGDPALPALLLLHQSPSTSAMYEQLMVSLASRFYLVAPDTPGFGNSDALPGGCDIGAYAKAMAGLLDALGIQRCGIFGHHTGAAIAVQLAHDRPRLCAALALSGPTLLSEEQRQSLPERASPFPVDADGGHLLQMWQRIRAKDPAAPLALIQREVLSAFACGDSYQGSYRAVCEQDTAALLPQLDCPVLVYAGDEDPLRDAVAPSLALLRDGREATLPAGCRTYVCEQQRGEVTDILGAFFGDVLVKEN